MPIQAESSVEEIPIESEIDIAFTETQEETLETETEELSQTDVQEGLSPRIPQRVGIVIDHPWEIGGKEQVYLEQYTIGNTRKTEGILTLSNLICTTSEQGKVIVKIDRNGGVMGRKNLS